MNENKGKEILNNNATNTSKPVKDNRDMKKKLMRIMLIVVGVLVLLLVVILIISQFSNGNKTYEEIEEDLKKLLK